MLASCVAALLLTIAVSAKSGVHDTPPSVPRCASEAFTEPKIGRGVTFLSVQARPQYNFTSIQGIPGQQPPVPNLNFCQVQIHLTHQTQNDVNLGREEAKDDVLVEVWLPLDSNDWNGRLQATGGAGLTTGMFGAHLGSAIKNGWAASSTDGGHPAGWSRMVDASWLLPNAESQHSESGKYGERKINWNLLHNYASRSIIDQILISKSITEQYYGTKPHHSYWNGCSTGGRQGYIVAQKYPELLDGILAVAPSISLVSVLMSELWPQVAMNKAKLYLSNCELEYFRQEAIKACVALHDMKAGIIEDPKKCEEWSPTTLVGKVFECGEERITVTPEMAEVVQSIHDGPGRTAIDRKFPGLTWGVPTAFLANIVIADDGTRSGKPFALPSSWLREVVLQGQDFDFSTLDEDRLNALWLSVLSELGPIVNSDDPDLTKLQDSGTKLLTWHGIHDQLIPYQNTIRYRRKVEAIMGGASVVDEYYRLFLAPGVEHCGGGVGPVPKDPLDVLVKWVEDNDPPETLEADNISADGDPITRNLCMYPATAQYVGIGDAKQASTWTCVGGNERHSTAEQAFETAFDYGNMQQPPKKGGGSKENS